MTLREMEVQTMIAVAQREIGLPSNKAVAVRSLDRQHINPFDHSFVGLTECNPLALIAPFERV